MMSQYYSAFYLFITAVILLLTITLFLPAGSAAGILIPRTYTGTNQCTFVTNRDNEKWAEMWCKGSYSISGTCSGTPSHTRLNDSISLQKAGMTIES
jgi:hypothetical protein